MGGSIYPQLVLYSISESSKLFPPEVRARLENSKKTGEDKLLLAYEQTPRQFSVGTCSRKQDSKFIALVDHSGKITQRLELITYPSKTEASLLFCAFKVFPGHSQFCYECGWTRTKHCAKAKPLNTDRDFGDGALLQIAHPTTASCERKDPTLSTKSRLLPTHWELPVPDLSNQDRASTSASQQLVPRTSFSGKGFAMPFPKWRPQLFQSCFGSRPSLICLSESVIAVVDVDLLILLSLASLSSPCSAHSGRIL